MHKSAAQAFLASTQNSFIWNESASDHSQKDWLPTERPWDTEPPYQKHKRENPEADLYSTYKNIYMDKQNCGF